MTKTDQCNTNNRQLIVLCDGTNNSVDEGQGTNVFRMLSDLNISSANQVVFYDPGVGSALDAPGTTWLDKAQQFKERVMGLAFGNGVFENIAQAYEFLMREYKNGDEIYVFGFSRGAFTARAVVGMVNAFGLLPVHSNNLIPMLLNVYFTKDDPIDEHNKKNDSIHEHNKKSMPKKQDRSRDALVKKVRKNCIPSERSDRSVHFVGVWDTVATLGIPPLDRQISVVATMTDKQGRPKKFRHVRQVLALDEQRVMFKPRQYQDADIPLVDKCDTSKQSLAQRWLPGAHCDVGGTYGDNYTLSEKALTWLLDEACKCGLRIPAPNPLEINTPVTPSTLPSPLIHSELYDSPYWAVAGMCVREARYGAVMPIHELKYPQDTVWKDRRSWKSWLIAAFFAALFYCASGWAALGFGRAQVFDSSSWCHALIEPIRLAIWQLQAVVGDCNPIHYGDSANLKAAVFWDTLMIVAYAYLGGRLISRAFASLAGLNTLLGKPRRILNVLGLGLMALVLGDLLENITTLIWLSWPVDTWPILLGLTALFVTLFSMMKLVGLALSISLMLWAVWHWIFATNNKVLVA